MFCFYFLVGFSLIVLPEAVTKVGVLKNFTKFTEKHLCWSLFLIKLQALSPLTVLKRDSNTCVSFEFWEICKNTFLKIEHLLWLLVYFESLFLKNKFVTDLKRIADE